ncbi:MAG: hypothetical protein L3J91_00940, partial [Thermoplasmata archaeon]|nr:hypothetical protein [Thermoplasmata archaeon]
NRPTIANHTVVLPAEALRTRRLTFEMAETAIAEFDKRFPKATGKVDPLTVTLRAPDDGKEASGPALRRLITKAAVETLVSRFLHEPHGRTLILCRGSTHSYRNELLYKLFELVIGGAEIPLFTAISDAPTLSAMNHFRLAISTRGVRADATWTLLDASIDEPAMGHVRGRQPIYGRVALAFAE